MSGVLAFVEVSDDGVVSASSRDLVAFAADVARQLREPLRVAVVGAAPEQAPSVPRECTALYSFEGVQFSPYRSQVFVAAGSAAIQDFSPSLALAPHTLRTREWMPRLAARLKIGMVTDCIAVEVRDGDLVLTKPTHGGSVIAQFVVTTEPAMATVRAGVGHELESIENASEGDHSPDVLSLEVVLDKVESVVVVSEEVIESSDGPSLSDANIIVSGGRGIGGPDNWHYVEELAAAVGGAVGCSRPVTDSGWVPAQRQVGLTGATVSPELYIAVGISGATQHLAGITGARTVVAINTDPDAVIFGRAQYGVVGDFHEVLPALVSRLKEIRTQ